MSGIINQYRFCNLASHRDHRGHWGVGNGSIWAARSLQAGDSAGSITSDLGESGRLLAALAPGDANAKSPLNALPRNEILRALQANWVNGIDLASQKAIAKSLIKLHLSAGNAAADCRGDERGCGDANFGCSQKARRQGTAAATQTQSDVFSRFDLIVTALLDAAYQHADQVYRNWTRGLAAAIAVVLALAGGWAMEWSSTLGLERDFGIALFVGLLATPLAPIAKDLSTALATAVNTMQLVKKAGSK